MDGQDLSVTKAPLNPSSEVSHSHQLEPTAPVTSVAVTALTENPEEASLTGQATVTALEYPGNPSPQYHDDGTELNLDGVGFNPDGAVINPDGTELNPESMGFHPDGAGINPDGTELNPDSMGFNPDGKAFNPDTTSQDNQSFEETRVGTELTMRTSFSEVQDVGSEGLSGGVTDEPTGEPCGKKLKIAMDPAEYVKQKKMVLGMKSATKCGVFSGGKYLARCKGEYEETQGNYLRGCKWSPDGQLVMTNSNDNYLRLFHLPLSVLNEQKRLDTELMSSLQICESDLVYDYAFYPAWRIEDDSTCLFATACRQLPLHMYSAVTGQIVQSYRCYDHLDEIVAPHSIGFTSDGKYLLAGFRRTIRWFVTNQPGRDCQVASTVVKEKDRRGKTVTVQGQRGIISCFAAHPTTPSVIAAGAYNGDVAIYDMSRSCSMTTMFEGQSGGITHMLFSKDGNYLYAGGRKDPEIHCFDLRNPEKVLYVLYRYVDTNQRMYFDLDWSNQYLLSGNHNGCLSIWDLKGSPVQHRLTPFPVLEPVVTFDAHADACNGCSVNPKYPLLATSSGQRHYDIDILLEDADRQSMDCIPEENELRIWNLKFP